MTSLPPEFLAAVFTRLDHASRLKCRQVAPSWGSLIDAHVGLDMALGVGPAEYGLDEIPCHFRSTNAKFRAISTRIGPSSLTIGDLETGELDGVTFGHPGILRRLLLKGLITTPTFQALVFNSGFTKMTHLEISSHVLMSIELQGAPQVMMTLPSLVTLKICSRHVDFSLPRMVLRKICQNGVIFIENLTSPKLANLFLDIPYLPEWEILVTAAVFDLLHRTGESIKRLDMYWSTGDFRIRSRDVIADELTVDWSRFKGTGLKQICLSVARSMYTYEDWKKLIKSQTDLQEMFFLNEQPTHKLTGLTLVTWSIKKLLLHLNPWDGTGQMPNLDCNLFTNCPQLSHLILRGHSTSPPGSNRLVNPRLFNLKHLPKTLQVLSLREVHVKTKELNVLLIPSTKGPSGWLNLIKLRLIDVGGCRKHGFGLDPEALFQILDRKCFQDVEIYRGMNRGKLESFQPKDLSEYCIKKVLVNTNLFHVELKGSEYSYKSANNFFWDPGQPLLRPHEVVDLAFA